MEAVKYAFAERETKVEHKEKEDTEKSSGNDKCADKEAVADVNPFFLYQSIIENLSLFAQNAN